MGCWGYQWRLGNGTLLITVKRGERAQCLLDGMLVKAIPLKGFAGEHRLEITVVEGK